MIRLSTCCCLLAGLLSFTLPASAEAIRLAEHPALSPDGQTLYFVFDGDIWTAATKGGTARRLTTDAASDARPLVSPDGTQLAFVSSRTGSTQVYLMPIEGGAPKQLTRHTEGYDLEAWMPDGRSLLVSGQRDHFWRHADRFFVIPIDQTTAEKPLFNAYGHDASISPDGQRLLFVREGERWWRKGYVGSRAAQIWLYDLETEQFESVLKLETECREPLWMPDGKGFYYVGAESGSLNLHRYLFAGKKSEQLTQFDDDSVLQPTLSADGKTVVFRHLFDLYRWQPGKSAAPQKIGLIDSEDRAVEQPVRRTLSQATEVTFTDDGLEMAFVAGGDVWVMDTVLKEPRRITESADFESNIVFSKDGQTLYFTAFQDGQTDIWKATRQDPDKYWWQNETFQLEAVTSNTATEDDLRFTPDGKHLAFSRDLGELWLLNVDTGKSRRLFEGFLPPDYDFSPDSRWVVYSQADHDFNFDIWIAPLDGSREPANISMHPDNESDPVWSKDGQLIAFTGRRVDQEVDVYYVWLQEAEEDKSSRARKVEKAIETLQKARKTPPGAAGQKKANSQEPTADSSDSKEDSQNDKPDEQQDRTPSEDSTPKVVIDFENIHRRLHRISIANSSESGLFWSATGHKLAFRATVSAKSGTYTVDIPDSMAPKLLTSTTGSHARWLKNNKIVWLANGVPGSVTATGQTTSYGFQARQDYLPSDRHRAAFEASWLAMRDWWYDDRFDNRNWNGIRRKYLEMARQSRDMSALADVIHLMLGELNGSHLGFRASGSRGSDGWSVTTAHLGLRFDLEHDGAGLRVLDVIPEGPTDKSGGTVEAGETVLQINGQAVDSQMDLTELLNGSLDRDIRLLVQGADEAERTVVVRPISYGAARSLLYRKWTEDNRRQVEQLSDGTVGYLHIAAMNWPSFLQFERELYAVGYGKDGLVIDVRENGGGFTTDHLLTALTQPTHAITVPRNGGVGYPQDRMVYATWRKPIVVLCNQNSFSNAEIFSHAIKGLKRGKVVGVPTAGGVISTGSTSIMDVGSLRRPFRGWFVAGTGLDMELNGAVPDIVIWPAPGELPAGKDTQLEAAVGQIRKDIRRAQRKPSPEPKKASELRAGE